MKKRKAKGYWVEMSKSADCTNGATPQQLSHRCTQRGWDEQKAKTYPMFDRGKQDVISWHQIASVDECLVTADTLQIRVEVYGMTLYKAMTTPPTPPGQRWKGKNGLPPIPQEAAQYTKQVVSMRWV